MQTPNVRGFFDETTNTVSYVVSDPQTDACAIIDSVLDFDPNNGCTSYASADQLIEYITANKLALHWILETHVHADHLSAAPYLRTKLGGKIGIGANIETVHSAFHDIFNDKNLLEHGKRTFDHLFTDEETFSIGNINAHVIATPGHTPACLTYVIGDAAFVGDTLFMPDFGTARTDFPGGDARTLYRSIQKIFSLPSATRLFMCHDYKSTERDEYRWESTVAEQRHSNIHIRDGISEDKFVAMREARDATLDMPRLIIPSVQVNMRAGELPQQEDNGRQYLKIPLNSF